MLQETTEQQAAGQVYGGGSFEGRVTDQTGRMLREVSVVFDGLRGLLPADAEQLLAAIRTQADELEIAMMGGEPELDGRDSAAAYMTGGV